MNLVKKILLVHSDSKTRRRCLMLLAGSGFDVRAFSGPDSATEGARNEWFDLALLETRSQENSDFTLTDRLRKIQPTLPVILLVDHLEFPLIVQGIRHGVSDVLPMDGELSNLVSHVCSFFNVIPTSDADLSSEELSQADDILTCLGGGGAAQSGMAQATCTADASAQLLGAAKEKALMERQLERLGHERNALEAQLKTLLAQNNDITRQGKEGAELRSQREIVEAAQAAIDEKARQLSRQRAELNRERGVLDEARRHVENAGPACPPDLAAEKVRLADLNRHLCDQADQIRAEATRLQQDRAQIAAERRAWHKDLDELRDKEDNLRRYEARLRELQAQLESERVGIAGVQMLGPAPAAQPAMDESLEQAWMKLKRATELFESERAHLREDRLVMREGENAMKLREATVKAKEEKLAELERRLANHHKPAPLPDPDTPSAAEIVRSFTRSPFATARAAWKGRK